MTLLLFGALLAYRNFSGFDPLTTSPNKVLENIISSEDALELIKSMLSANPQEGINKAKQVINASPAQSFTGQLDFKFAIVSDSHNDNTNLAKALAQAKIEGAQFVVGLGDYTDVGTLEDFKGAKLVFDNSGLPYYVTAGDHDLWDARDKGKLPQENFIQVFNSPYQSFAHKDIRLIIFFNADNYQGIDDFQSGWLEEELARAYSQDYKIIFAMGSIPLYHPSSDHVMGKSEPKLKDQAQHWIKQFSNFGVDEVFAGDTHFYSRYQEPSLSLNMTAVGAVTSERNLQEPNFTMVDVYKDGSYNVTSVKIK